MKRGLFITFEGGEGAGKTTQIRALHRWLKSVKQRVIVTRQPGGTKLGTAVRKILLYQKWKVVSPRAEVLLYEADRAQHVDEVA